MNKISQKNICQCVLAFCLATFAFLPSNADAAYALTMANGSKGRLMPSSTYYLNSGNIQYAFIPSNNATSLIVPESGTITAVYGNIFSDVASSEESCTINIIKNGLTVIPVTTSLVVGTAGYNPFSNPSLNLSVTAGDVLQMQMVTPAWSIPPVSASFSVSLYIE